MKKIAFAVSGVFVLALMTVGVANASCVNRDSVSKPPPPPVYTATPWPVNVEKTKPVGSPPVHGGPGNEVVGPGN